MFKNLDGECFGIAGRQNEVVEFALSNGYDGISVDFTDLHSRAAASGVDFAARFLVSAKSLNVGVGRLNFRIDGTDDEFNSDLESLTTIFEIIDAIRGVDKGENRVDQLSIIVKPFSDKHAYHDNFELHRTRIGQIADKLAEKSIRLGIGIQAAPSKREGKEFEFVYQPEALITLVKTIGKSNVGISLNTWDWLVGGGALDQLSELSADQIVDVTLTDMPNDVDLTTVSNTDRLMPGAGDSAFCVKVCKWLHENNFAGPITPGPSSSQFSGSSRDAVIHKASNAIDEILVEVGAIEPTISPVAAAAQAAEAAAEAEAAAAAESEGSETEGSETKKDETEAVKS